MKAKHKSNRFRVQLENAKIAEKKSKALEKLELGVLLETHLT